MTIVIIILIIIGLFIFIVVNSGKKENVIRPNLNSKTKPELLLLTELRIQDSKKLLGDNRNKHPIIEQNFENESEYEVTGIHILNRKIYILENCSEYDEVEIFNEINNPYSEKAIAVKHQNKIIGYISDSENKEVHEIIKGIHDAKIIEIAYDGSYLTVRIIIGY